MVKNIFTILSTRQTTILSGAAILMLTVITSKVLGLIRDRLMAHIFSPESVAVFFAAFRIPDLMFQLLIFGAVSVAFIPIFIDYLHKKDEEEAFEFASDVLNLVILVFSLVSILVFILADPLTFLIAPGFTPDQKALTAQLTRVIMLGQILLSIGAFFAAIAQSYQRFIIPSLAAVMYNLGIILGILIFSPFWGLMGVAYGVIIGASLHVLIQIPLISHLGFQHRLRLNFVGEGLREVGRLMSMRTVGIAVEQINETVGLALASLVSTSSVTYLTFAQHLQTVPIGLFGATLAQAALPVLSRERAQGETSLFKATLLSTMHQILFLTLPSTAILIILRIPAVRLVFGASQFDWEATVLTGATLAYLSIGLTAQSVALLLMRGFYALKDTKTPVIVSVTGVLVNITLSYYFVAILKLPIWSLGLSYAISSNLSWVLLLTFLGPKMGGFKMSEVVTPLVKILIATVVSAIALYLPIKALDRLVFDTTKAVNLLLLTGIASTFGLSVYLLMAYILKIPELFIFAGLFKRLGALQSHIKSEEIIKETGSV